ncbi:MAG: HalX domain-containing protein [Halodesulfurarchaeum sp.]
MTDRPSVLIVEDERELATLYADWLADEYDVSTAYTVADAREKLDEETDVVLLDRRMPESSGDTVLDFIDERGLDPQVAMVTAVDPDFDIIDLGFDAYVIKPVERQDLRELVRQLLIRGLYNDQVRRYFSLVSKRANLEATKAPNELESRESYRELIEEIEEIEARLDDIVARLDDDDFAAVLRSLKRSEAHPQSGSD